MAGEKKKHSIPPWAIPGMLIRQAPLASIRQCLILAEEHDFNIDYRRFEEHHTAGGDIRSWVEGMVYAKEAGLTLSVEHAAARELIARQEGTSLVEHIRRLEQKGYRDLNAAPLRQE